MNYTKFTIEFNHKESRNFIFEYYEDGLEMMEILFDIKPDDIKNDLQTKGYCNNESVFHKEVTKITVDFNLNNEEIQHMDKLCGKD